MRLEGKNAVVTGGATGIGSATAKLFAQEGAQVTVADINEEAGRATVQAIEDAGGTAWFERVDASSAADVERLMSAAAGRSDGIDIVVNTAGAMIVGLVDEFTEDDWDTVFSVNVKSIFLAAKYAVPHMRGRGAAIVNTSSGAALRGAPAVTAYCGTKGAVVAFSRALAMELAPDIRVNVLSPGWTDTPFNQPVIDAMGGRDAQNAMVEGSVPMARQAVPEEMAAPILFLVSDDASYMTSGMLVVDGGNF